MWVGDKCKKRWQIFCVLSNLVYIYTLNILIKRIILSKEILF